MSVASAFLAMGLDARAPVLPPVDPGAALRGPPIEAWSRPLPGRPPNSASRAEPASPVVWGNFLLVGGSGVDAVLVLDRRDGALRYELPTGAPVACAPVVADGVAYVSDSAGYTSAFRLAALDVGKPMWKHFGGAPILSSPTLSDGVLYVTNVNDEVVALDAAKGELRWRYAHELDPARGASLELYGAPSAAVDRRRGELLVGFSDGFVVALRVSDGEPRWNASIGEGTYPDLIAPAQPVGDMVIVGGYSEPLLALDPEERSVRWRVEIGSAAPFTLEGVDGGAVALFHGGTDGRLRRIDPRTGEVVWVWSSGDDGTLTRPVPTERGLLVGSSDGSLHLVDPATGAGRWSFEPGIQLEGFSAAPVLDGNTIYAVSNAGRVYALEGFAPGPRARARDPWVSTR